MRGLIVVVLLAIASPAAADGGRVALVDMKRLYAPFGIGAWVAASAKLDAEEPNFKVVESPDGTTVTPESDEHPFGAPKSDRDWQREHLRWQAWNTHWHAVIDPIEADVMRALDAYAKAHGITLLLDRAKLGDAVVVIADGADITDAFIKEYNARAKAATK